MAFVINISAADNQYINRTEAVNEYFNQIRKFPILSAKEERRLLYIAKNGSGEEAKNARDKLINCNQRFIVSAARKWQTEDNLMDIIFEGTIGLIKAIDNFDLNKEHRFLTYAAFWIRKAIKEYLQTVNCLVKVPNANKTSTYANKARESFFRRNERYPTTEELQDELLDVYNVKITDKRDLDTIEINHMDLCSTDSDKDSSKATLNAIEVTISNNNVNDDIDAAHIHNKVTNLMHVLNEKETYVIRKYYGLEDNEEESFSTIALNMGITEERVRQIYAQAMKKMRKHFIKK